MSPGGGEIVVCFSPSGFGVGIIGQWLSCWDSLSQSRKGVHVRLRGRIGDLLFGKWLGEFFGDFGESILISHRRIGTARLGASDLAGVVHGGNGSNGGGK